MNFGFLKKFNHFEYENGIIVNADCLEVMKIIPNTSIDLIFADPPYALGSKVIIRPDGKPDYKKAVDFMNKWDMPTAEYWEKFFKEAFRVLKYGGYCLMFSMDRQNFMFKYYAHLVGFEERQSLYWYYISNFPKASDLSKMIDKYYRAEINVIGEYIAPDGRKRWGGNSFSIAQPPNGRKSSLITAPATPLAKKYNGYKYSIAPLKQVVEEIMVFQKPYKTGSCLHDTLAYENGNKECCCGAVNVNGNRVELKGEKPPKGSAKRIFANNQYIKNGKYGDNKQTPEAGRYPAQMFIQCICDEVKNNKHTNPNCPCAILDKQSGVIKSTPTSSIDNDEPKNTFGLKRKIPIVRGHNDIGGYSKILHKIKYEQEEYDLLNYCPKVSSKERLAGTEKNSHPTLKPIRLNEKILRLFKTPNPQKILIPFCGAGSEIIGAIKSGFEDIIGIEINPDYVKIAEARIKYWTKKLK